MEICPGNGIENILGKEKNAGYQHFLLFPKCFQKLFSKCCKKLDKLWESVLCLWIALLIVNKLSKSEANIFKNYRDITKCPNFCTTTQTNKAFEAIPLSFL